MILYFADRTMQILGHASTELPDGLMIMEDLKTEEVENGTATFECKIPYNTENRAKVEACTEAGNYLLRSHNGENEFYTIIETEGVMRAAPAIGQAETQIAELAEKVAALQTRVDSAEARADSAEERLQDLEARLAVLEANNDIFNA